MKKSQIWTLSLSGPSLPPIMGGGGGSSSAISPLKIWDVLPHYLRIDTVRAKNRKLIILTIFAWTTPLIVEYSNHKILPFLDCKVSTNQDINLSSSIFRKKKNIHWPWH